MTVCIEPFFKEDSCHVLYNGDCFDLLKSLPDSYVDLVITSPPYCIGKTYEDINDNLDTFTELHRKILPEISRVLKTGGSICWQVGYQVKENGVLPLDFVFHDLISNHSDPQVKSQFKLRNRIIWTFGHGLNSTRRFSGRHEVIMWYSKGNNYEFNLDNVRVPQKYPGKRHYKGDKKGEFSGNPLGKNPSDVWEIPNVKANHVEKTIHPCQFPVAIPLRLIRALTSPGEVVLDPFCGSCSTGIAAVVEGRKFIGAELSADYYELSFERLRSALSGTIRFREDYPVIEPDKNTAVAQKPTHFANFRE